MRTVYVVGIPGSGKTTLVTDALALAGLGAGVETPEPIPHVRYGFVWHLGRHRDPFGGTDTLAMNINPKAIDFMRCLAGDPAASNLGLHYAAIQFREPTVVVGEGDRLANTRFFAACPNLTVVWLDTPIPEARARAARRAAEQGTAEQPIAWWKGRVTKIANLVSSRPVTRLDGTALRADNATALATLLTP